MKRQTLWLYLLVVLPITAMNASQGESEELKEKLCKDWKYEKCRIMGVEYSPKKEESNDLFQFQNDMTFTMVEEGVEKTGTWKIADIEKQVVDLEFSNGTTKQLKIEELNSRAFVYTIIADWQYDVTIYMGATSVEEPIQVNGMFHFAGEGRGISLKTLLFP